MEFLMILFILLGICVTGLIFTIYMGYRNECVYRWHINLLDTNIHEYRNLDKKYKYNSYGYMMKKWWIWPLDKFLE